MLIEKKFAVRKFSPDDLGEVVTINRASLPENYANFFFLEMFHTCPDAFLVAELNAKIVGYIMCRIEHGFSDLKRLKFLKKGHIISVAVLPEFRRMGIGDTLVEEGISALARLNAEECYLEVRVSNEPAVRLYAKLGFQITRKHERYYYDGADAWVMCREIETSPHNQPHQGSAEA